MDDMTQAMLEYVTLTNELLSQRKQASPVLDQGQVGEVLKKLAEAGFVEFNRVGSLTESIAQDPNQMVGLLSAMVERAVPRADSSLGKVAEYELSTPVELSAEEKLFNHFHVPFTQKR